MTLADRAPRLKPITTPTVEAIPQLAALDPEILRDIQIVSRVLPFRVNAYVLEQLIDWSAAPDDPMFRLVFPQRSVLDEESYSELAAALAAGASHEAVKAVVARIRGRLNPHPADQLSLNRPVGESGVLEGVQQKYAETVLFFPSDAQTCHSYCAFCFRWPQFINDASLRFASSERESLWAFIASRPSVTDLLITGGDAFSLKASRLRYFLEPALSEDMRRVQSIRLGTKALSFWPHRFLTDPDADEIMRLIERLVREGKHVAVMAHYNHWRELDTDVAKAAIARLRSTGAVIRTQGPLLRGVNDDATVWAEMWRRQVVLGLSPYYMFVARDTGAHRSFDVPLVRAFEICSSAQRQVSGLARTARGPVMSASPGKIEIAGMVEVAGERALVLRFIQARNPEWSYRPFFASYDEEATWFGDLKPAFGEPSFFFENKAERKFACDATESGPSACLPSIRSGSQ